MPSTDESALPRKSQWLWDWFVRYCIRYAGKHFDAVRLSKSSFELPKGDGEPLVFIVNHPAWWDIIICLGLTARYKHYRHYAPIDAKMLPKYKFFNRLGFFGVDDSIQGTRSFLKTVSAIFAHSHTSLWITAQGHFVDPRVRPVTLRPGVGHLASKLENGWLIPIALEYPFWDESKPEALIRFGVPLKIGEKLTKEEWTQRIEQALEQSQDILAVEAMSRDENRFTTLISGKAGIGGVYDLWRRFKALLTGRKASLSHRDQGTTAK